MTDSLPEIPQIKVETTPAAAPEPSVSPEAAATEKAIPVPATPRSSFNPHNSEGAKKKFLWLGLAAVGLVVVYSLLSGLIVYKKAVLFKTSLNNLVAATKSHNLEAVKQNLAASQEALTSLDASFRLVAWLKVVPFLGGYVRDAQHGLTTGKYGFEAGEIVFTAISPYADLLGFDGSQEAKSDGTKTTKDRIDFIVKSLPDLVPKVGEIAGKANLIKDELSQINPNRYPVKLGRFQVRSTVKNALETAENGLDLIANGQPLLENAPYLLGIDGKRTYLVIFQNDKELRPTGGFLTAYAIMTVDKGKFSPVASNDIYNLDAKYKPTLPAPNPIVSYLKGPYTLSPKLRLRDMNWSPSFAQSMETFTTEAAKVGISGIDGVISVDTQVLVNLLKVIGPIGVPGYGNFSAETEAKCNCPNVIYELENLADIEGPVVWDPAGTGKIIYAPANYDNRKKMIGPLMNSVLANAMGQPKEKLPPLFEAGFRSLLEKHLLFYLFDHKVQTAVESFGIAGTLKTTAGDYLFINDANLGGRKSNLYVTQEVEQEFTKTKDGYVQKTVTITYKNPEKQDGWLNSVLPDWVRVYVPKGSQLISFDGVETKGDSYEDLDKTVFAGFFQLRPEGIVKLTLTYRLPFKYGSDLSLFLQKQPGTDAPLYRITVGRQEDEFFLKTDKEIPVRL